MEQPNTYTSFERHNQLVIQSAKQRYLQSQRKALTKIIRDEAFFFQSQRGLKSILNEIKDTVDPENLLKSFHRLKFFSHYESIQICYLPKASKKANILSLYQDNKVTKSSINAAQFHNYFQSIRKSKNKFFQTNVDNFPDFHQLGTFLAIEKSFPNISILFMISRNDFLRPTKDEYQHFYHVSQLLLEKIKDCIVRFEKKKFNEKKSSFFSSIEMELEKIYQDKQIKYSSLIDHHQNERLKIMSNLLDTLKHELSNPLFGVKLAVENLIEFKTSETKEVQTEVLHNIERCHQIIENFVSLYGNKNIIQEFDIVDAVNEALTLSKSATTGIKKKLTIHLNEKERFIRNNKTSIIQILFNAILNAAQAMATQSEVYPSIEIEIAFQKDQYTLKVIDNGPGLASENSTTCFKPFFTTKTNGTGLGLSICKRLAGAIHANVSLSNQNSSKGACFKLEFTNL